MNSAVSISSTGKPMTSTLLILDWSCRVIAAIILLQTLFFKFTGAPESVYIFTRVGAEPWGRIGSGVVELIAVWNDWKVYRAISAAYPAAD